MDDYAVDRSRRLERAGFTPSIEWKERSIVSVSENGKTYKVSVAAGLRSAVFQIDGVVITTGSKCDKFLAAIDADMNPDGTAVFIELKGKDISHAIDQLEATLKSQQFMPKPRKEDSVRARIVTANCGPKSSSKAKLEEARIRFKTQYNTELRVLKNQQSDISIT